MDLWLDLQKQAFWVHNFWPQILISKVEIAIKLNVSYGKSLTTCSSRLLTLRNLTKIKYQSLHLKEAHYVKCAQRDGFRKLGHILKVLKFLYRLNNFHYYNVIIVLPTGLKQFALLQCYYSATNWPFLSKAYFNNYKVWIEANKVWQPFFPCKSLLLSTVIFYGIDIHTCAYTYIYTACISIVCTYNWLICSACNGL